MNETTQKIFAIVSLPIVIAAALFFAVKHHGQDMGRLEISIGVKTWVVDIADTEASRSLGLSGRDSLCGACGMLFRFDALGKYDFWMKNMRFPLDFAWIREGRVVFLERNVPVGASIVLTPDESADSVLEVNAGDLSGVSVGDPVFVKE